MSAMQVSMRIFGTQDQWFDAEIDVGPVLGSNGLPVVKTDVVVFKTSLTQEIFGGYEIDQFFTYETANGDTSDVYFIGETDEVFAFSTHPHLM